MISSSCEKKGKKMASAQRNRGTNDIAFTPTPTPTPTPRSMLLLLPRTKKRSTDGETTISMYPFRRVSCCIQYTYNSSHKINLFSLQFKIK